MCQQKHKSSTQSQSAVAASGESEIGVTWTDQQNINLFSRLNLRLQNMNDELISKRSELANTIDAISDIDNLLDDELGTCKIKVGQVFVSVTNEDADEYVQRHKSSVQSIVDELESQSRDIRAQMNELKSKLYAKFGNQINLEYDDNKTQT